MARGQRKSVETKIQEKQALIAALRVRLQSEERELNDLRKEKRNMELEKITAMLEDANISVEEAQEIIAQHRACAAV